MNITSFYLIKYQLSLIHYCVRSWDATYSTNRKENSGYECGTCPRVSVTSKELKSYYRRYFEKLFLK